MAIRHGKIASRSQRSVLPYLDIIEVLGGPPMGQTMASMRATQHLKLRRRLTRPSHDGPLWIEFEPNQTKPCAIIDDS